ncbi:DUF3100 domain-containing protein [Rhodococcus opacus]|uniref:DUF3100 domain-containing protein n=1 Tax=Rhodococcus opacus TaxID=37919 RepID=UPI0029533A19|nr:DUF3100 domain-containing protein [Rhodococcus opacus]MDV7086801.1 DUF3100 domain-containing protein [Rhodococcus opacus]
MKVIPAPSVRRTPSGPLRREVWLPAVLALVIVSAFQAVGVWKINLGPAAIAVYPMVWALLAGGFVSAQRRWPLTPRMWAVAESLMSVGVSLLVARLSLTLGPNVDVLFDAGPALLLQEVGHLVGTVAIALPLAVALRMGRATVGATFSIDREASFAIVGDRFGVKSDEYRGVLSMYVFGTMFGAVIVALIASLTSSLGIFDPLALAMGAGVGSGSMMAAGAAAISAAHPEVGEQVLALAATSNLITMILGVYVGVWIALPLADRLYRLLTRSTSRPAVVSGERTESSSSAPIDAADPADTHAAPFGDDDVKVTVPLYLSVPIVAAICIAAATIAAGEPTTSIPIGFTLIVGLMLVATALSHLTRGKITAVIWASVLGVSVSGPWFPGSAWIVHNTESIDFMSMCAVVLGFAGLAVGKNLPALRMIGWKIVPVGFAAIFASFLLSTLIAEFALGFWR